MKATKATNNAVVNPLNTQPKKKQVSIPVNNEAVPLKPEVAAPSVVPRARTAVRANGHEHMSCCSLFLRLLTRLILSAMLVACTGVYAYTILSAAVNFCNTNATKSKNAIAMLDFCHHLALPNQGTLAWILSNEPLRFQNEPGVGAVHANLAIGLGLPALLIGVCLALGVMWCSSHKYQSVFLLTCATVVAIPHVWYAPYAFVLPSSPSTRQLGALIALQYACISALGLLTSARPRGRTGVSHILLFTGLAILGWLALSQQVQDTYPEKWKDINTQIIQPICFHVDNLVQLALNTVENLGAHIKQYIQKD